MIHKLNKMTVIQYLFFIACKKCDTFIQNVQVCKKTFFFESQVILYFLQITIHANDLPAYYSKFILWKCNVFIELLIPADSYSKILQHDNRFGKLICNEKQYDPYQNK